MLRYNYLACVATNTVCVKLRVYSFLEFTLFNLVTSSVRRRCRETVPRIGGGRQGWRWGEQGEGDLVFGPWSVEIRGMVTQ
jgi:hypothetical protein